jgi:ribose transport system permease protein
VSGRSRYFDHHDAITGGRDTLRRAIAHPVATAILALLLVFALGLLFSGEGAFYKWSTHRDAMRQASVYGILACGMTVVIITAGIDLSVGSVLGLVAVSFAIFGIHRQWSAWLAIPACLAIGSACGVVSGLLTARFRIQPFIVTLAMMVFARGLAKKVSGGMKVSTAVQDADGSYRFVDVPAMFDAIDSRLLGENVSVVSLIFLACVLLCWIGLSRLRWGRYIYAIGGNEEAARLSGVPVVAMKVLAYGLCGFFAAVAGICQAAQEQQGDPEAGVAYELRAIAIVVIGGTNLMGGRGGVGLTLLGTLIIGYLDKILSINAVPEASRLMLTGAIIIGAVLVQRRQA